MRIEPSPSVSVPVLEFFVLTKVLTSRGALSWSRQLNFKLVELIKAPLLKKWLQAFFSNILPGSRKVLLQHFQLDLKKNLFAASG
jgi:hypothetical protein